MRLRSLLATACLLAACTAARAQPASCENNSQCAAGYFCDNGTHSCRECLRCDTLNRETPKTESNCVESISKCGNCLEGLVVDVTTAGAACKQPAPESSLPAYVWAAIGVCLALFVIVLAALVYILRHTDTVKVWASTRTSVQTPGPTAPQPPPYNPYQHDYEPVRLSTPLPEPYEEPLVKSVPAEDSNPIREPASNQRARVFNNPAYVRNVPPASPPSYWSAVGEDSEPESLAVHDENTMESPWSPNGGGDAPDSTNVASNSEQSSSASGGENTMAAVRRAIRADTGLETPAKVRRVQDTNNNRDGGAPGGESSGAAPAPAAPSFVINVLNVNSVHQLNDVTL